jgi:hypothetical protein
MGAETGTVVCTGVGKVGVNAAVGGEGGVELEEVADADADDDAEEL